MKRILTLLFLVNFLILANISVSQVYLELEDFENVSSIPDGWSEEYGLGFASWIYKDGGREVQGLSHPESAYEGNSNAAFIYNSDFITKLISPSFDLSEAKKPALIFAHAMQDYGSDIDELNLYFKPGIDSSWILLKKYTAAVPNWLVRTVYLPDSLLTSDCYIAFEGVAKYGDGVCIDSVLVIEKDNISKRIDKLIINTASNNFIPTGASNNPILRVDFNVVGNTNNIYLNSLTVKSLNTTDEDISPNGVKLYYTEDTLFNFPVQIGGSKNFTNGIVEFDNLNQDLPYGITSVWVCYDIKQDVDHEMHEHIVDAMIEANGITVSGNTFPFSDKSPEGSRIIYESIFYDDFESVTGWTFNGEFERGKSAGKGTSLYYTPDPLEAYSGDTIIGTDLSDDGNYEPNLPNRQDSTLSPTINSRYYKDVHFTFYKWLNVDNFDEATVDLSLDAGATWSNLWINSSYENDSKWNLEDFDISNEADREENIKVRFAIGNSDGSSEAGGWNIDDVALVGNYISKDVGISNWLAPSDGCGHTNEEQIKVTIKNYAGETINERIPLSFSIDGGTTIYRDTTPIITIPIEATYDYTLSNLVDFSTPGWYNNIYVTTNLASDEISSNNKLTKTLFISPTLTVPYSQNFETSSGYWKTENLNAIWEYGVPAGVLIKTASSGTKVWATKLSGDYPNNASSSLETPCFNTSGYNHPMVDLKIFSESEKNNDGMALLYSTDNGQTWNLVPNNDPYDWNWYNNENIAALGHAGWDTTTTGWFRARQILPPVLADTESFKLKLLFKSNNGTVYEGFAIDDFKIYDAPLDVGILSLVTPFDTCEWSDTTEVKVYIENYGPTTIETGTKIPVVMDFNSSIIYDTLSVTENIAPNDSVLFVFNTKVDMSYAGDYDFKIYTNSESDPYFYNDTACNDTLIATIKVEGMPQYNPFPALIGDEDAILTLDAEAGYTYIWQDATTNQTFDVSSEGEYSVTVTNGVGCTAIDSVEVVASEIDLQLDSLFTILVDSCERTQLTEIKVHFVNLSINSKPLPVDSTYLLSYQVNDLPIVTESITITGSDVEFEDTVIFTFIEKCDFTEPGSYAIKVYTDIQKDLDHSNDSISKSFNTWGFVNVELEYDTIYSSQADTLVLTATPGYDNYIWNNDSTGNTVIPYNKSYYYKVTASDGNICLTDTAVTYIETHDLGVTAINSPMDRCEDDASTSTNITIEVTNYSNNIYNASESITVFYNYDDLGWIETTPVLPSELSASGVIELTLDQINTKPTGEHTLIVYTSSDIDANHSNDTLEFTFNTWPNPSVDLEHDTIYTTKADTIVLVAQDGYSMYIWNEDTTNNDSLSISSKTTQLYKVQVEDSKGCGKDLDSTMIITYNLGITSMIAPESNCTHSSDETITFELKNYGADNIPGGTTITIGYIMNGTTNYSTNYIIPEELEPNEVRNVSFSQGVDISDKGLYTLKIYIDYEYDAYRTNDTIIDAIKTFGNPEIDLGNDIFTTQTDTVEIIANNGYISYWWNEGTENDTLQVTKPESFEYVVTVTDINGCNTSDSLKVYTYNVIADSLSAPIAKCEFTTNETVSIGVTNNGADTLLINEPVEVGYRLNSGTYVSESFALTQTLYPNSTEIFTMTEPVDISALQVHEFKLFAKLTNIDVETNDTTTINTEAIGYPSFSLGEDIYAANPVGIPINGPVGYAIYEWQDGTTSTNFTISYPASATYSLTVTDDYGCEGSDALEVYTYNVVADTLKEPFTQCELTNAENITIGLTNYGADTLLAGEEVEIGYRLNSGEYISDLFNLTDALHPDSTEFFTFTNTEDLAAIQTYNFKLFAKLTTIDVEIEDTVSKTVDVLKPIFDLGDPQESNVEDYEIDAGAGFESYDWFDGSTTTQTYTVNVNEQNPNYYYAITVTNSYGCEAIDSLRLTFTILADLSITQLYEPTPECWVDGKKHAVKIEVSNVGGINLNTNTEFTLGYTIDDETPVTESYILTSAFDATESFDYKFNDSITFPAGKVYEFKPFVKFGSDGDNTNDTLTSNNTVDISAPEVDFGTDTVTFTDDYTITLGEPYDDYIWSTNETSATITITETGDYSVTVTDDLGCQASGTLHCRKPTGIDDFIHGNGYSISYYPNPASDELRIDISNTYPKDLSIEIINIQGQVLQNKKYKNSLNTVERIDVSPYSKGVYYIRFKIDDRFYIRKLIIQ